jgi:glycosyltransferase involved in cell wall biosynthesis
VAGSHEGSMTIGVFTDDFYPHQGGMGRCVYEVTRRLAQDRLLVFSPSRNELRRHVQIRPPLYGKLRNISLSLWLNRKLEPLVRGHGLTRLNVHCGPGGLFLFDKPRIPVLATSHHTYWQQSRLVPNQLWKRLFVPFEALTYRLADKVVAVSEDTRRVLLKHYRLPMEKIVVVPNGVDRQRFYPLQNAKRIMDSILYVGRIDKRKGLDFLIESLPIVLQRNSHARLFIGGTGRHLSALMHLVRRHGLGGHVEFLGYIPETELNAWYNRVMCLVVPSRFEGFGITAVEAMAAGTSVIAANVDGLREIIRNGVNGCLVDYGNRVEMGETIATMLENPAMRQELSRNGIETVKSRYDWDAVASRISEELDRLAGCPRAMILQ